MGIAHFETLTNFNAVPGPVNSAFVTIPVRNFDVSQAANDPDRFPRARLRGMAAA